MATVTFLTLVSSVVIAAPDTTPAQQLQFWSVQAGSPGQSARGKAFFLAKHGKDLSCASCHSESPLGSGKHASTGKAIAPLAPAANPESLTDTARINKWFRRNCNDVLARECTPQEKADVIAFLSSLKR
ncbi:MAG: DUF1924 domain-containing protein [Burkholderiaceae bacterium]|nr:DUF1924 domain-containing protein [Burkholderiaceae bacterium]